MPPAFLKSIASTVAWPVSVWQADRLGTPLQRTWPSGFSALDAELPGGGWPSHALVEILSPCEGSIEWRLLTPLLARLAAEGREIVLVGPPHPPHPPGLSALRELAWKLIWVQAETEIERLWCAEQLVKANGGAVVLAWLPRVRLASLRRLQVLSAGCEAPLLIFRPGSAVDEASAAPLRVRACAMPDGVLSVDIFKRKGPPLERSLLLRAMPADLAAVLPPRLSGLPFPLQEPDRVVVRPVLQPAWH